MELRDGELILQVGLELNVLLLFGERVDVRMSTVMYACMFICVVSWVGVGVRCGAAVGMDVGVGVGMTPQILVLEGFSTRESIIG